MNTQFSVLSVLVLNVCQWNAQLKQIGFNESIRMAEYGCVFSAMQLPLGCICVQHSYEYGAYRMKLNYRYEVVRASGPTNAFLSIISFYLRLEKKDTKLHSARIECIRHTGCEKKRHNNWLVKLHVSTIWNVPAHWTDKHMKKKRSKSSTGRIWIW